MPRRSQSELLFQSFIDHIADAVASRLGSVVAAAKRAERKLGPRRKGQKRTPALIARTTEELFRHIKSNAGKRIEEISRALGHTTKDLALPVQKLLASRKISTKGRKRATKYFAA